jgi:hypothetical protein
LFIFIFLYAPLANPISKIRTKIASFQNLKTDIPSFSLKKVFITALKGSKMIRTHKIKVKMLELLIIIITFLALVFIYLSYIILQMIHLKKSILAQSQSLQLQLRHLVDLVFFSKDTFSEKVRVNFIKSNSIGDRLAIYQSLSDGIKSTNHSTYPNLYLEFLSQIHNYNNDFFIIQKMQGKFLYNIATKIIFSSFPSYTALSTS